jgi:hypothetical protein
VIFNSPSPSSRRGVAMLIVLAAAVLLLSAASVIARSRATTALAARTDERLHLAWAACEAAEAPVLVWLERESRRTVLPPDAPPMVRILDDPLTVAGRPARITVVAWDQNGMIPAVDTAPMPAFGPLLTRTQRGAARWIGAESPGLDLADASVPVFPTPDQPTALGARVATHNPPPGPVRQRGGQSPAINIHTAPEPLLRAAYEHLGLPGVEAVLRSRRAGERSETQTIRVSDSAGLRLVGVSTAWGVRTDVTVDGLRASVWSVYTLRAGTWIREQRLAIAE